jgi:DUF971 family protein
MSALLHDTPTPTEIKVRTASKMLEISYSDGKHFDLPFEFLRVYSPSAEVRGHGPGQEVLQLNKQDVQITAVEPVGAYAVQLRFSDGHDTGLYSWQYLYELGSNKAQLWAQYLQRVGTADAADVAKLPESPQGGGGCGSGGCGCH